MYQQLREEEVQVLCGVVALQFLLNEAGPRARLGEHCDLPRKLLVGQQAETRVILEHMDRTHERHIGGEQR